MNRPTFLAYGRLATNRRFQLWAWSETDRVWFRWRTYQNVRTLHAGVGRATRGYTLPYVLLSLVDGSNPPNVSPNYHPARDIEDGDA